MTSGTTKGLGAVWGSSGTDVFAVGPFGTILHYNGTEWSTMTSGTSSNISSVWGSSATDVFAVGELGNILHYDGTNWSYMTAVTTNYLYRVWGITGTDAFTVGASSTILHFDLKADIYDLPQAIMILKLLTGTETSGVLCADINGNTIIGIEEVIYILQKVANLR